MAGGGNFVASCVVELSAVPFYSLVGESQQQALERVDDASSRLLANFARQVQSGAFSFELLLLSEPVENQLYKAQPHVYAIVRSFSSDPGAARGIITEASHDMQSAFQQLGYTCKVLSGADATSFEEQLERIDCSSVHVLTREGKCFSAANTIFYYNEPVPVDPLCNLSMLTNALTERPNAAFSLQLIPTSYSPVELKGVEQRRMCLDVLRKQIMMTPEASMPTDYVDASRSYLDFIAKSNEPSFYFLPAVYSSESDSDSLVNKLLGLFAARENPDTHMLRSVHLDGSVKYISQDFLEKPWEMSDVLVFESKRGSAFWSQPNAPRDMFRLHQLVSFSSAKCLARPPFDDGNTIGLRVNRNTTAREKLDEAVLSTSSFRIGSITDAGYAEPGGETAKPQAGIPLNHFSKHGMIVGKSGSGKTNFVHTMLIRLAQQRIPFLAIEPTKKEYRCLKDVIPDLVVFTPGMNGVSPFIINPFIPPVGVTVESYIPCLMSAFETAFTMPDPLPVIFREAINKTYNLYGWKMSSTCDDPSVTPFGFHELIRVFQDHVSSMEYEGETRGNIQTAGVLRLSSLIEQNANIYDTTPTIPVHELLRQPVVLELNAITAKEQKTLLMALLLVSICNYTKFNTPLDGDLKNILLIDEAHVLFKGSQGEAGGNRAAAELEDMIAEIRAYGTGVFVADQSPSTFGPTIVANTDTKVMFQTVEKDSKNLLAAATGMSEQKKELLSKLDMGECLLYYGKLPEPILVKADDARNIARFRRDVPDAELRSKDEFWRSHRNLLMPFDDCRFCSSCVQNGCDLLIRDSAEFVASKMVNFYNPYLKTKNDVARFVATKAERNVAMQLKAAGVQGHRAQAGFCVMTRFMRKLLRSRRYQISNLELARLRRQYLSFDYADAE